MYHHNLLYILSRLFSLTDPPEPSLLVSSLLPWFHATLASNHSSPIETCPRILPLDLVIQRYHLNLVPTSPIHPSHSNLSSKFSPCSFRYPSSFGPHSYPKANTGGCTTQAKLYRDNHTSFTSLSYTVYGLSNDSPTSLTSWKEKQRFPYDLISDPKRELIKALTGSADKTKRSHFVVDGEGKLAHVRLSVKPGESWEDALGFLKK